MSQVPDIASMNPVAEAGSPNVICPVVFLTGCNLRCAYCLNSSIIGEPVRPGMTINGVVECLGKWEEDTILISGGEPCMNDCLLSLVSILARKGISVRLATNGSFPGIIDSLIRNGLISFVALDIKFDIFSEAIGADFSEHLGIADVGGYASSVRNSVDIIESYASAGRFPCEYRTTLYPPLVDEKAIRGIARGLEPEATWVLQQYRDAEGSGFGTPKAKPYDAESVQTLLDVAKSLILNVYLREP